MGEPCRRSVVASARSATKEEPMSNLITRWDPFSELAELRGRVDRMLGEDGHHHPWAPAIDVVRDDDALVLRADLPGLSPDEVKIEVADDVLTVSGAHEDTEEHKGERFVRRERRYGAFSRSMALPAGTDAGAIKARTHDGVLEITVPLPEKTGKEPVAITPTAA
jgi:HSP20 family protein